jgi:hypothetical protein
MRLVLHDAAALKGEGGNDGVSVAAIELGDGVAGGGVEAKQLHEASSLCESWGIVRQKLHPYLLNAVRRALDANASREAPYRGDAILS